MNTKIVSIIALLLILATTMIGFGYGLSGARIGAIVGLAIAILWVLISVFFNFQHPKQLRRATGQEKRKRWIP
jgi:hypothetical protein